MFAFPKASKIARTKGIRNLWSVANSSNPVLSNAISECSSKLANSISPFANSKKYLTPNILKDCYLFALISNSYSATEISSFGKLVNDSLSKIFKIDASFFDKADSSNLSENADGSNSIADSTLNFNNKNFPFPNVYGTVVDKVLNSSGILKSSGISLLFYNNHFKSDSSFDSEISSSFNSIDGLMPVPFSFEAHSSRENLNFNSVGKWYSPKDSMPIMNNESVFPSSNSNGFSQGTDSSSSTWSFFESVSKAEFRLNLPENLNQLLLQKYGLVGSQTPFINGQDFSLIYKNELKPKGIYGVAFYSDQISTPKHDLKISVSYPGFILIGKPALVTRSRGNIILEIENASGVEWLKVNIETAIKITKIKHTTHEPYARFISENGSEHSDVAYSITGGDPKRGGISIDTKNEIVSGHQYIQMMYPDPNYSSEISGEMNLDGDKQTRRIFGNEDTSDSQILASFGVTNKLQTRSTPKELIENYNGISNEASQSNSCPNSLKEQNHIFGGSTELGFYFANVVDKSLKDKSVHNICNSPTDCSVPNSYSHLIIPRSAKLTK
ncbi:hypothetical protein AYI70_g5570 [Smittium culicis]|uniref:Uncharacterized protein n=1 Tax=Smittium culicis TaxID=133412 RepID=A0A1R1XTZ8_9FUNG|nr:hypothetical protein AYI70_g5570 [Smittium culicis]